MSLSKKLCYFVIAGVVGLFATTAPAYADPYVVGGASGAIVSDSGGWAWDGSFIADFRGALENPAYFGAAGIVNQEVQTVDLPVVSPATLAGIDMFVATWISDAQAAPLTADVLSFFLGGGDLFLLQDDDGHDAIGDALGISTSASTGTVSNGGAPFFIGPFGVATDVTQHYLVGQLSAAAIAAANGHVVGTNEEGQVTSAFWLPGEYAPGSGSLFIIADVDMIASTPPNGATYNPLNSNGIYALNTFSFLQQSEPPTEVPEPATIALVGAGLVMAARKRLGR